MHPRLVVVRNLVVKPKRHAHADKKVGRTRWRDGTRHASRRVAKEKGAFGCVHALQGHCAKLSE